MLIPLTCPIVKENVAYKLGMVGQPIHTRTGVFINAISLQIGFQFSNDMVD